MRNANGWGSVVRLSGNRRRPFGARITLGFDERGYPKYKFISYHEKREDALTALVLFRKDPYDVDMAKITMKEVFEKWLEREEPKGRLSKSSISSAKSAFKHCSSLHGIPYKNIKAFQMQEIIDKCGKGYSTQGAIKTLWKNLDLYAMELDIITKKNSELIHAAPIPPTSKLPFTDAEVQLLWEHADEPWVDTVLIFMYSGWRISELLELKREDVDLEAGTMTGGLKTKAGKNRIVPIHSKILPFVQKYYEQGGDCLISLNGKSISDTQYRIFWNDIMNRLGMKHTPHEARHTFRSRLDSANGNQTCINLMMGHTAKDVGERIYTHKRIQELKATIELIKN